MVEMVEFLEAVTSPSDTGYGHNLGNDSRSLNVRLQKSSHSAVPNEA